MEPTPCGPRRKVLRNARDLARTSALRTRHHRRAEGAFASVML